MSGPRVAVLVATYRRAAELRRLGECLAAQTVPVARVVVADNAADAATRDVVERFPVPAVYLPQEVNGGCGHGLRAAEEHLLAGDDAGTHWWILDDDAVPPPETLQRLLESLAESGAGMAVPLLADSAGRVWAFPEPVDRGLRRRFRETDNPEETARGMGAGPHRLLWATGACQLVAVEAARRAGLHRTDFWMLGEDLDFSMRVALAAGAVFRADLCVPHLPPPARVDAARERAKFCALLQNLTYLAFHNPGSAHLWRYLPGNYLRFFRTCGWSGAALRDAADCFLSGGSGWPAAGGAGRRIRRRMGGVTIGG